MASSGHQALIREVEALPSEAQREGGLPPSATQPEASAAASLSQHLSAGALASATSDTEVSSSQSIAARVSADVTTQRTDSTPQKRSHHMVRASKSILSSRGRARSLSMSMDIGSAGTEAASAGTEAGMVSGGCQDSSTLSFPVARGLAARAPLQQPSPVCAQLPPPEVSPDFDGGGTMSPGFDRPDLTGGPPMSPDFGLPLPFRFCFSRGRLFAVTE